MINTILQHRPSSTTLLIGRNNAHLKTAAREAVFRILSDKRVFSGIHPDCTEMDARVDPSVDAARKWVASAQRRPFEGDRSFLLLVGVDLIDHHASNALLKTVEQPPPFLSVILTAENTARVIPTLLSRSYRVGVPCHAKELDNESRQQAAELLRLLSGRPEDVARGVAMQNARQILDDALPDITCSRKAAVVLNHIRMLDQNAGTKQVLASLARALRK